MSKQCEFLSVSWSLKTHMRSNVCLFIKMLLVSAGFWYFVHILKGKKIYTLNQHFSSGYSCEKIKKNALKNLCYCQLWNIKTRHLHQWAPRAKTMQHPTLPNAFVPPEDTTYDHLYIWTPSTVPGPVYDHDYPLDIFIAPWQTSSSAELERDMQNARVAPQCWCGTSEFCVEIISLFSCHLGSGCWRVAWARCFMGNTTERHTADAHG